MNQNTSCLWHFKPDVWFLHWRGIVLPFYAKFSLRGIPVNSLPSQLSFFFSVPFWRWMIKRFHPEFSHYMHIMSRWISSLKQKIEKSWEKDPLLPLLRGNTKWPQHSCIADKNVDKMCLLWNFPVILNKCQVVLWPTIYVPITSQLPCVNLTGYIKKANLFVNIKSLPYSVLFSHFDFFSFWQPSDFWLRSFPRFSDNWP